MVAEVEKDVHLGQELAVFPLGSPLVHYEAATDSEDSAFRAGAMNGSTG